jgi:tetratricopeptide (TPR) repeat protein
MDTTPALSATFWPLNQPLPRERYLQAASAALAARNARFARQALLNWLAFYPGDLLAALYYARAMIAEGRLHQAVTVLRGLCKADPEFSEAIRVLLLLDQSGELAPELQLQTAWFALTGRSRERQAPATWGGLLASARQAMRSGKLQQAEEILRTALSEAPDQPLVALTHLQLLAQNPQADPRTRREIALLYHQRWPDCLQAMLWLAEWTLAISSPDSREADEAVALLHQAAARDIAGQVARRLWGENHRYRSLWPERLELALERPLPAEAAALLGWNLLKAGDQAPVEQAQAESTLEAPVIQESQAQEAPVKPCDDLDSWIWNPILGGKSYARKNEQSGDMEAVVGRESQQGNLPVQPVNSTALPAYPAPGSVQPVQPDATDGLQRSCSAVRRAPRYVAKERYAKQRKPDIDPVMAQELQAIGQELDNLAKRSDVPGVSHLDGRFPVYVIFSVRAALQKIYGERIAALVESEMTALAQALQKRHGWTARVFMADDPASVSQLGIQAARPGDPWDLKLALADLDCSLGQHGERIGALLIVGGPEIVPFHHLPNPVDDQDDDVPSDNPYAALDENYFIPEWPVGRLPGGAGNDARLLIDALQRIRQVHESANGSSSWLAHLRRSLLSWFKRPRTIATQIKEADQLEGSSAGQGRRAGRVSPGAAIASAIHARRNFGYTAAVWQKAAALVFRPIGRETWLRVSPPFTVNGELAAGTSPELEGHLGYFNLHGLVDAPEWYGQSDPKEASAVDYDYPVALRPQDIVTGDGGDSEAGARRLPQVIFSEACYGLHILGRCVDQAIALRFLEAGSLAVAGSTCMAYGSIGAPLVAADLLGQAFWRFLKDGMPAGEALRQAKLYLAGEMHNRQGYLDGEDQKTLISFVLYGDPLAQPARGRSSPKNLRTRGKPLAEIKTVCDRLAASSSPEPVPHEVMTSVRRTVARYLPGMSDAQMTFAHERAVCAGEGHNCPTHEFESLAEITPQHKTCSATSTTSRSLVTLSKQVPRPGGVHPRIARLTLDEQGKLVKLVVSR